MKLAGTGHRPNKLGGYEVEASMKVAQLANMVLEYYSPTLVISGMAQGWDQALAQAAYDRKIPFHAYIPFEGQEYVWPSVSRYYYRALLAKAALVKVCSPGDYSPRAMQVRNQAMVNDCDLLIALWNNTPGGTANCLQYAAAVNTPYINVWSNFEELLAGKEVLFPEHTSEDMDDCPPWNEEGDWLG